MASGYHRAFGHALICLTPNLKVKLNLAKLEKLKALSLVGGPDYFRQYLEREIFLPANPQQRLAVNCIRIPGVPEPSNSHAGGCSLGFPVRIFTGPETITGSRDGNFMRALPRRRAPAYNHRHPCRA